MSGQRTLAVHELRGFDTVLWVLPQQHRLIQCTDWHWRWLETDNKPL